MNKQSPHKAGPARTPGQRPPEASTPNGLQALRELAARLELVPRLQAIADELGLLDADETDVPRVLCEGLLEDVARTLADEHDGRP